MKVVQRKGVGQRIELKLVGEVKRFAVKALFRKDNVDLTVVAGKKMMEIIQSKFSCFKDLPVREEEKYSIIEIRKVGFAGNTREEALQKFVNVFSTLDVTGGVK